MSRSRKLLLTISIAAMLALAGGAVVAAGGIPGADGVIHGCYNASNGQLRVIDPASASCKGPEAAIQWNQTGPQGIQGLQGAQGDQGAKGDTGEQGPQGATGAQGPTGQDGANGLNGANGADGRTVLNGTGEPDAALGADGDFYIATDKSLLYGPKANGIWGTPTHLIGPQGAQGAQGDTGAQGPAGANGVSGYQQVVSNFTVTGDIAYEAVAAGCPSGTVVLGGGVLLLTDAGGSDVAPKLLESGPSNTTDWVVKIDNTGSFKDWAYSLVLTCANAN